MRRPTCWRSTSRPDNRNLLTKLMAVYSDDQGLVAADRGHPAHRRDGRGPAAAREVLQHRGDDRAQELSRLDEAADYYEEALEHCRPTEGDARSRAWSPCLTENRTGSGSSARYERRIERMPRRVRGPGHRRDARRLRRDPRSAGSDARPMR